MVKMSVATAEEQVTNPLLHEVFSFCCIVTADGALKKQLFVLCAAFLKSTPS